MIEGFTAPGLEAVKNAFAANFEREGDYQELGAALCVYRDGQCVIDLWGGYADAARTRRWEADTLVNVWSTTKGAAALAVALLVDRGLVAYEQRVAEVWPAFAQNGKAGITIAQAMSHQAGLPGFEAPTTTGDLYDWDAIVGRLERQAPVFEPGAQNSYHAVTYGFLAGEIVRRVAGVTLGELLLDLTSPTGADFHIGVGPELDGQIAQLMPPKSPVDTAAMDLSAPARMALSNPELDPLAANTAAWRRAELPALNGHASARGVARLYGLMIDGSGLISPATIRQMTTIAADRVDLMLGFNPQWGMGVAHNLIGVYGPNPRTVAHSGWGGSFGAADPDARIVIGYVCNQMGSELVGDPRGAGLAAAIYASLGS